MKSLFLASSIRTDSVNKKLAKIAYKIAKDIGHEATFVDLKDYPMPLYNGDDEVQNGLPAPAKTLKALFAASDSIFIASAEYNSGITPLLCNTISWLSRPHQPSEAPLLAFRGKIFALGGASPGGFGGMRALVHLRLMLSNIGGIVLPDTFCLPLAYDAFNPDNSLKDSNQHAKLQSVVHAMKIIGKT